MAEEASDFVERFNREGGPVPAANPDHIKMMWNRMREAKPMRHPGKPSDFSEAVGIDASFLGESARDNLAAITIRLGLLRSLLERDVLRDYVHGDEVPDEVFATAADIPCDKEEFSEAMLQLTMKQRPDEDYSEWKREMIANGYDPNAPKIDAKFLMWLGKR